MSEIQSAHPETLDQPAIDFLTYIKELEPPEDLSPEEIRAFLVEAGPWFIAIGETHGRASINSAGYQQLRGSFEGQNYLASFYPSSEDKPAALHAYFGPPGQDQPLKTITFFENALPLAQRSEMMDNYGRRKTVRIDEPLEIFAQMQEFSTLVLGDLADSSEQTADYEQMAA